MKLSSPILRSRDLSPCTLVLSRFSRIFASGFLLLLVCASGSHHAHATPVFEPVQAFLLGPENPASKLLLASDGNFYGTTSEGGTSNSGTVFKMTSTGALTILVNFNEANGQNPSAGLVEGADGNFYGTTGNGGSYANGTAFKVSPTGTLTTLIHFTNATGRAVGELIRSNDGNFFGTVGSNVVKMTVSGELTIVGAIGGMFPSGIIQASDGNFYGTTRGGGSYGTGTAFKMTPTGTHTTLVSFITTNGSHPTAGLVQGRDGNFYGTTIGGLSGYGTAFKMTPSGTLTNLVNFTGSNGLTPVGSLVQGSDGNFYGMTANGGSGDYGTVFKMTSSGTLTTLLRFNGANGRSPRGGLIQSSDGNFYGTTSGAHYYGEIFNDSGTVFKMTSSGTLTTLVRFTSDHGSPRAPLLEGSDGNFYGTTTFGGTNGYGAVFKMTSSGAISNLVNFSGANGSAPYAALTQGGDGNFYGTTYTGGSGGYGTVFRMTSSGTLATLVNFTGANGGHPQAALVQGSDGNFYGTTWGNGGSGYGTVFKMTSSGTLTTLVDFSNGNNGRNPYAALVQGSEGDFYGTTHSGGYGGSGSVFKVTASGAITLLSSFNSRGSWPPNGEKPTAPLIQGNDGNFYGTTSEGGVTDQGTIFRITPTGALTYLADFTGANGRLSNAALLQGSEGNFYGTTTYGGSNDLGTVFQMTPSGTITTLMSFNGANGSYPYAGLIRASDGNLYGTTSSGGTTSDGKPAGGGQIFRLRMGPTVASRPQTNVTTTGATLNGTVNPGGHATPVSFRYGTDPTLATYSTIDAGTLPSGTSPTAVQAAISGLQTGTTYHFRVVASSAENTVPQTGTILSFTPHQAPSFSGFAASAGYQSTISISFIKLLGNAVAFDGYSLAIHSVGTSANGGGVVLGSSSIAYTPPVGFSGTDTFAVTIHDSGGGSVTGTITITVNAASTSGGVTLNPPVLTMNPDGTAGISFQGIPGRTYLVQRSGNMIDWTTLVTLTADASGNISYTDPAPPPGSAFYRLAKP